MAKVEFETGMIEPAHHREFRTINELAQLDISYGVTEKFTVSLSVPFLNDRKHEHIDGLPGPGANSPIRMEPMVLVILRCWQSMQYGKRPSTSWLQAPGSSLPRVILNC